MAEITEREKLIYRGKPLIRDGNVLYFGDFEDNFIARFTILETKNVNDLDMATKITIELLEKNGDDISSAKLTKKAERTSMWAALDIGIYWLEDILEMEKEFLKLQG
ncbi:MAG: hypothetical protein IKU87_03315 [Clostridia bacterium]|nr:hypothetical protein [Clostridia bacterium]